ncbi:MAG: hypothetical protein QOD40_846 [Alphaproteobacteria bacterium]|nr:hypothetical protein [Alphaproteobacteria bacterium]
MLIASRMLKLRDKNSEIAIPVRIFAPKQAANGSWFCHYEIDWPGENHKMDIWGADSVQALVLTMQIIGAEIYSSNYHKSGMLCVDAPGKGYGFPVVPTLRGLLQGDDPTYF